MNMYDILSTALINVASLLIMLYYCNSAMEYKESRFKSNCIAVIGYIVYFVICSFGIVSLNLIGSVIVNAAIIYFGYKSSIGRLIIQVTILTVLMMFGEIVTALIINENINNDLSHNITVKQYMIYLPVSKLLYFIFVVIFKYISSDRSNKYRSKEMIWLIILPITTCAFFVLFNRLNGSLSTAMELLCIIISIMLIASTLISYIVCELIVSKNYKIQYLQSVADKQAMDSQSYKLMKEKYAELKIMTHDFNKYCSNIEGLLTNEQHEALSLIQKIKNKNREFMLVEYTNNQALNILLSQKMRECNNENIDFSMYIKDIDLSFIEEFDVIAIFANLIDNAIDSCKMSAQKRILLNINIMNGSYIVIRIENSADNEPVIINNRLSTWKHDPENHGIGFWSIKKALAAYNGSMDWTYSREKHTFMTTIMINISNFDTEN